MTKLTWDAAGQRFFEANVDRGVLYTLGNAGVPWNGLTGVDQKSSGGDPTPYYIDGVKYLNVPSAEEYEATLEAFTYPDEFAECDGLYTDPNGLMVDQQYRKQFNLAYRTLVGNDISGVRAGYKLHLICNALAGPSDRNYATINEAINPLVLSWDITTTPIVVPGYRPTSHLIINSTKTNGYLVSLIEDILYGTSTDAPRFPTVDDINAILLMEPVEIIAETITGLSPLVDSDTPDLIGHKDVGLYKGTKSTKLVETSTSGLYTLES